MEWVKPFFDRAAVWWGPPRLRQSDEDRAGAVERICGIGAKIILELGAGGGTTTAAMASRGHHVTAIELSATRIAHARELLGDRPSVNVTLIHGDFYTAHVGASFDCVTYWNGFGVGTDADQRMLLRRVASEWLAPSGTMILDVFSPWRWSRNAGTSRQVRHAIDLVNAIDFDPAGSRFVDRWWPVGHEGEAITQYGRCYTPADLVLLLEGTGLRLLRVEVDGCEVTPADEASTALWDAWEYRAQLVRDV